MFLLNSNLVTRLILLVLLSLNSIEVFASTPAAESDALTSLSDPKAIFHKHFSEDFYTWIDEVVESKAFKALKTEQARRRMLKEKFLYNKQYVLSRGAFAESVKLVPYFVLSIGLPIAFGFWFADQLQVNWFPWGNRLAAKADAWGNKWENLGNGKWVNKKVDPKAFESTPLQVVYSYAVSGAITLGGMTFLAKDSFSYLYAFGTSVVPSFLGLRKPSENAFEKLELQWVQRYHIIRAKNPGLNDAIKKTLTLYRKNYKTLEGQTINFLTHVNAVPLATTESQFDKEKFEDLFEYYDPVIKNKLLHLVFRQHILSEKKKESTKVFPTYFEGFPGTGKTLAAENLAKALGVPFARVTLDGATIQDLLGSRSTGGEPDPGRILSALAAATKMSGRPNYENMVLFIDEFDRVLSANDSKSRAVLSFMLKILDPNNRTFFSPYLNANLKLPSVILLAGNHPITDEALANRFDIIKFPGYDHETKWKIAQKYTIPQILKLFDLNPKLSDNNLEELKTLVYKDNELGLRGVEKSVIEYFEDGMLISYLKRMDAEEEED